MALPRENTYIQKRLTFLYRRDKIVLHYCSTSKFHAKIEIFWLNRGICCFRVVLASLGPLHDASHAKAAKAARLGRSIAQFAANASVLKCFVRVFLQNRGVGGAAHSNFTPPGGCRPFNFQANVCACARLLRGYPMPNGDRRCYVGLDGAPGQHGSRWWFCHALMDR